MSAGQLLTAVERSARAERAILLRYHEIALKGENRGWFEERLAINARKMLRRALGEQAPIEVIRQHARVLVETEWSDAARAALDRVFGIQSYSPMRVVPTDLESFKRAALEELEAWIAKHGVPGTFRVRSRRSEKVMPQQATEIDREVGGALRLRHPSMAVDLKEADFTVGIEIRSERSYLWVEKIAGPGGLPVGTNARVLSLISGGIDSPVAAIQILRRGSPVSYLHFYGAPFVGEDVIEKVEDLARVINRYQPDPQTLHIVPFGKIQEKVALATNPKMRTVLYRRMMVRIACEFAKQRKILAIATGESLGQVASQTVENLSTIDEVATLPVLRPLIACDKDEIIAQARRLGTFETSIRPGVDCCTLFADRHPTIRSVPALISEQEKLFPVEDLVREALEGIQHRRV